MIEDIYEPLARYRDEFAAAFLKRVQNKFIELAEDSHVNRAQNRTLISRIRGLEKLAKRTEGLKGFFKFLMIVSFLAGTILLIAEFYPSGEFHLSMRVVGAVGCFILGGFFIWLVSNKKERLAQLEKRIRYLKQCAWNQMEPLNQLYTWDMTTYMIEQTVPRLSFDPFFSVRRLDDLKRLYGWDDSFNDERSMLFAQSGEINGNPFVFGEFMEMEWEKKRYTGTLFISWTERYRDGEGHIRHVTRSQTLVASVEKPIPVYSKQKFLIYGNEAAPDLTFSRKPSDLSGAEEGFFTSIRKKWGIHQLEKFSNNLDDDSNYTLMGNHDFELLFHATDRSDEVQFRLLFTPLAQKQMLELLQDTEVGYGDDFIFVKEKKLNLLFSQHLDQTSIDTDPKIFYDYDFDRAARRFINFNVNYFKNIYFSLAPLLAIPLYQQTRTHENIYQDVLTTPSSFWEHESLANYHGEEKFQHPQCITNNILKTRLVKRTDDGVSHVAVTANGYKGIKRVEHVPVLGGDGRMHAVPVPWIEFSPVSRTSEMCVSEGKTPPDFDFWKQDSPSATFRRAIYSYLSGRKL